MNDLKQICRGCTDHPGTGCWKDHEYGCTCEYNAAQREAIEQRKCPIGKFGRSIDLRAVSGCIYTAAHRRVLIGDDLPNMKRHIGPKFHGDFRIQVAHDFGRILLAGEPPFLLLEDDCTAKRAVGVIQYPPDAEVLMLGGGKRGAGRGHLKVGAKRAHGYSYEDYDDDWFRVWAMLYTHAMLFLTPRALELTGQALSTAQRPGDQITAVLQHQLVTYCMRRPLFIQQNNDQTWNYAPGPSATASWPAESPQDRIRRLRADRQRVLAR